MRKFIRFLNHINWFLPDCLYHQNLDGHKYSRIITDVVLNQTLNQSIYLMRVLMRRLARSKHPSLIHIKINKNSIHIPIENMCSLNFNFQFKRVEMGYHVIMLHTKFLLKITTKIKFSINRMLMVTRINKFDESFDKCQVHMTIITVKKRCL